MTSFRSMFRPQLDAVAAYRPTMIPEGAARLDANECSFPLSIHARARLAERIAGIEMHRYPDVRATPLREAVAKRHGVHPDRLILGCGSDEVIALLISALSGHGASGSTPAFLFPDPTFVMFRISALGAGALPVSVALDAHWDLDVAATCEAIERHAPRAVFLPSPNNPTGRCFSLERIERVIECARGRSLVVLDEAYGRFAGRGYDALREIHPHVAQLGTLSKVGFAAARVGWAVLPEEVAAQVDKVRQPYNLNTLSQRVGEMALGELSDEIDATVARIVAERERLVARLGALQALAVSPSDANFVWVDTKRDSAEVFRQLLERGVVVRSFSSAGGRVGRHLRITVGTPEENDRLLEALTAVLC